MTPEERAAHEADYLNAREKIAALEAEMERWRARLVAARDALRAEREHPALVPYHEHLKGLR